MKRTVVIAVLVVVMVIASVTSKKIGPSGRPARCNKATPRKDICKRLDQVWYWNGRNDCKKLPNGCYNYGKHDNAFESKMECMRTCMYD